MRARYVDRILSLSLSVAQASRRNNRRRRRGLTKDVAAEAARAGKKCVIEFERICK